MKRRSVTFVVMAGGRGERLWPLVRSAKPKVCLSPDGTRTLLQATVDRLRPVWPGADWLIVTTQAHADAVRESLPVSLRHSVLVEPQMKNTAACITLAAVALAAHEPQEVMVVVPADHWIGDVPAFRRAVRAAIHAAVAHETIATIGIRPTQPQLGLGYLCAGGALNGARRHGPSIPSTLARLGRRPRSPSLGMSPQTNRGVVLSEPKDGVTGTPGLPGGLHQQPRLFRLARFVEKPSRTLARRLMRRPKTYWNSGIFVGTADTFLECITEWLPEHTRRLVPLAVTLDHRRPGLNRRTFAHRAGRAYRALEAVSFDHGVMDHLRGGIVVEGDFPWADLGSWDAWARLGERTSPTIAVESENVTVVGHDRHLVATIGVRDLLVVHTPSATLICRPNKAQAVRDVVKRVSADPQLAPYR